MPDTTAGTLTDFLLARIAETEPVAKAALVQRVHAETARGGAEVGPAMATVSSVPGAPRVSFEPERVLAECQAKRRIVELHTQSNAAFIAEIETWDSGHGIDPFCSVCGRGWPCDTLRLLALPYAAHPLYDAAWRP